MATIFKRANSRFWYVKYYVNGQQIYRSLDTTSERVARKIKQQIEADESRGELIAPSKTPLAAFLEDFCQFMLTVRTSKSLSGDLSLLRVFFGPVCPSLKLGSHVNSRFLEGDETDIKDRFKRRHVRVSYLEDVTADLIETFISTRIRQDKISPKTANRQREILHRMFQYAIKNWRFTSQDRRFPNPAAAVERRREPAPEIRYLKTEQIVEQLAILKDHPTLHAMVAAYIYAGVRREELLRLTLDDVDLDRRLMFVRAKTIDGEFWQPKTKRNRVVPISFTLRDILAAYQPLRTGPWFFPSTTGRKWDPDNFSQELREVNREHGLEWSCLDFRHTFGSHLAQNGISLFKIAELMGNSPDICRKHYAALCPEKMHDAVEFDRPEGSALDEASTRALIEKLLDQLGQAKQPQPRPMLRLVQ